MTLKYINIHNLPDFGDKSWNYRIYTTSYKPQMKSSSKPLASWGSG